MTNRHDGNLTSYEKNIVLFSGDMTVDRKERVPLMQAAKELGIGYSRALQRVLTGELVGEQEFGRWMVDAGDLSRAKQEADDQSGPHAA